MKKYLKGDFLKNVWLLTRSYWSSEEKYKAYILLTVIIALSLAQIYALVLLNKWYQTFYSALQVYDNAVIIQSVKDFCVIAGGYILVGILAYYLKSVLQIRWRIWMTKKYLVDWLDERTYYLLQVFEKQTDNPDQRISDDIRLFVENTITLVIDFIKNVVLLISFIGILWTLSGDLDLSPFGINFVIPKYMVWATIIYAIVGTYLTDKIGRVLGKLNFIQQKYEADFRFSMVRLRENSENVAFYEGENYESEHLNKRFAVLIENLWRIINRQKWVVALTTGYSQMAVIVSLVLAIPKYLSKQIDLGTLMQITAAFGRVQDALSFFVDSYVKIAEWSAIIGRLTSFHTHMQFVKEHYSEENVFVGVSPNQDLQVENVTVSLPNGGVLIKDLNISFSEASTWLVKGASGTGKSTFLRVVAGLWPYVEGKIYYPQGQRMFLPQKSYLPLGSLREVLLYPGCSEINDEQIKQVLQKVHLPELSGNLDKEKDWSQIFSLGEQQRIAFARVLLHKPKWLFLDEATSAMDEELEYAMYSLLKKELPQTTLISIGHRSTLHDFHTKQLQLLGDGKWQIL